MLTTEDPGEGRRDGRARRLCVRRFSAGMTGRRCCCVGNPAFLPTARRSSRCSCWPHAMQPRRRAGTFVIRSGVSLNAPARGQEFSFDFPLPPASVHYVAKPVTLSASGAVSATFTVATKGSPLFDYRTAPDNTCDRPATVRLFLQRRDDPMSGEGDYEFYRRWSNVGAELKDRTVTLDVPLQPALWTSVFGKSGDANPCAFAAAMADLGNIGITFGGGCFFGHGVRILNGGAIFSMNRFAVHAVYPRSTPPVRLPTSATILPPPRRSPRRSWSSRAAASSRRWRSTSCPARCPCPRRRRTP